MNNILEIIHKIAEADSPKIWQIHVCGGDDDQCDHYFDRFIKAHTKLEVINILFQHNELRVISVLVGSIVYSADCRKLYKAIKFDIMDDTWEENVVLNKELIIDLLDKHSSDISLISILNK